jgi:PPOX class probable F420-dependent enzyme
VPRLTVPAARRLLAGARVARLATVTAGGAPHLVPVTFVLSGDVLYTAVDQKPKATTALRRLANIRAQPRVSVLADYYAEDWGRLWWVRADGTAAVTDEPDAMAGPAALLASRYPQYRQQPPRGPLIAVTITSWAGWAASG